MFQKLIDQLLGTSKAGGDQPIYVRPNRKQRRAQAAIARKTAVAKKRRKHEGRR